METNGDEKQQHATKKKNHLLLYHQSSHRHTFHFMNIRYFVFNLPLSILVREATSLMGDYMGCTQSFHSLPQLPTSKFQNPPTEYTFFIYPFCLLMFWLLHFLSIYAHAHPFQPPPSIPTYIIFLYIFFISTQLICQYIKCTLFVIYVRLCIWLVLFYCFLFYFGSIS